MIKKSRILIIIIGVAVFTGAVMRIHAGIPDRQMKKETKMGGQDPAQSISMTQQVSEPPETQQEFETEQQEVSLESGGTWIDELYNNIITGNCQPVVELMKDDSAFLEAYDAAYDAADGLLTSSGHWVGFHEVWGSEGYHDRSIYVAVPEWEQNKKEKRACGIRSEYYFVNYLKSEETEMWSYYKEISYMDSRDENIVLAQGSL